MKYKSYHYKTHKKESKNIIILNFLVILSYYCINYSKNQLNTF